MNVSVILILISTSFCRIQKISCFHEGIGVCEQLMGIPIPLSYTRLTSRFLVLWHLTLPIILWDDCNWIVVPATFVSAASLFCIEEVPPSLSLSLSLSLSATYGYSSWKFKSSCIKCFQNSTTQLILYWVSTLPYYFPFLFLLVQFKDCWYDNTTNTAISGECGTILVPFLFFAHSI